MLKNLLIRFFLLLLLTTPAPLFAVTPPVPAVPPGQVVDLAGIIDTAQEQQLVDLLHELEQKTTVQMVILTITSLDGEDINSFSLKTAEQWQLGRKENDNGLLLTVAREDKKYRFETGYGLESVLSDSLLGSIGRKALVPYFKQGNYGQGIGAAAERVIDVLARMYQVEITGKEQLPAVQKKTNSPVPNLVVFLPMLILFIIIISVRRRNRKSGGGAPVIFPVGWGSGGGFGGGIGGFGGGGGGFGGGGASGGW